MRAGRVAGRADIADELALPHLVAGLDDDLALVAIARFVAVDVLDQREIAVAVRPTGLLDDAIAGRIDRRSFGRGEIDASVQLARVEDNLQLLRVGRVGAQEGVERTRCQGLEL